MSEEKSSEGERMREEVREKGYVLDDSSAEDFLREEGEASDREKDEADGEGDR